MQLKEVLAILNKTAKLPQPMTERLQRWRNVYYGISLHTTGACPRFRDLSTGRMVYPANYHGEEYQYIFDNYLMSRHPRESEATRNWRFSQYKPLTKAPFGQITGVVQGAIFQDANYTLELTDPQDHAYVWQNRFSGYDIIGYLSNIGLKNIIEDPNGVFLRIPSAPFYEQTSDKVEVDIWFVNTKDMLWFTQDDLIFLRDGFAYWVDKETVWRFSYKAQDKKYYLAKEDAQGYYAHMMGRLPITIAGGEWNTKGYFDSYFSKAKAAADDFISAYSAAQLVDKEASHPFIVEASTDCPDCDGRGQVQHECESCPSGIELVDCHSCSGSGQISRNPGQRIIVPQEQMKDGAPIQVINPDVSINTHHREVCKQIMELIAEALHLQRTDAAQSGVAKAIDQERLYKLISAISNDLFDKVLTDSLQDILTYRNSTGLGEHTFRIVKPTQFQIKTSADLLAEYNEGTKANMPAFIRQRMALDYIDKQYSGDAVMKRKAELITRMDELSLMSTLELLDLRSANAVTEEAMLYSRKLPIAIDKLIHERGEQWFLHTKDTELEAAIDEVLTDLNTSTLTFAMGLN